MNRLRPYFVLATALLAAPFLLAADSSCDDFLSMMEKKPKDLEFIGCKQRTDLQGEPFEATYRVAGTRAAQVETYLVREFKVKRLRRTCCVWESVQNSYRDKQGRLFIISMSTDETTIGARTRWARIPYFHVTVARYREDP
jgi:Domian of unknown function (DUF4952)